MSLKNKRLLFVIAPKNFKDEEYYITKEILESMGIKIITASSSKEAVSVAGRKQITDITLDQINTNYDGIVFIGGPGSVVYFDDQKVLEIANEFFNKNKLVAAICIAPSILANSGILQGKRATAFPSEESNLIDRGAIYTANLVTIDDNIITGKNPGAAREFSTQIIRFLGK
ncbi:MAG: DJ-1/PfpI family protein [Nanoarchaeota archaeon]|nr:DJ-1/PfpI family protein [Nanoarchaeota archaeon]